MQPNNKLVASEIALDYKQPGILLAPDATIDSAFALLTDKGMDNLTDCKIEHIICTTALAAFF